MSYSIREDGHADWRVVDDRSGETVSIIWASHSSAFQEMDRLNTLRSLYES